MVKNYRITESKHRTTNGKMIDDDHGDTPQEVTGTALCDVGYDESVNPTIANSFATAAFRFGHTQVQSIIHGRDAAYNVFKNITLSTVKCLISTERFRHISWNVAYSRIVSADHQMDVIRSNFFLLYFRILD